MALFRALETARPSRMRLFSDPYAHIFLDAGLKFAAGISAVPAFSRAVTKLIERTGKGALSSGIARTKYIDDLLEQAIRSGVKQVFIPGAGFDTRGLRLEFLKDIPVTEIDHPDTAKYKQDKLKKAGLKLPENITSLQIDFNRQSLDGLAKEHNFNFNIPATIIWEGVTNYLTKDAVDKTFEFMSGFAKNSYIIFTYIDRLVLENPQAFIGTGQLFKNLAKNREQWTFGFKPEELSGYLSNFNLTLLENTGAVEYRAKYMPERKDILDGYEFYRVAFAKLA